MKTKRIQTFLAAIFACVLALTATVALAADPLPSWNDGPAKQSIITFVEKVTKPSSPDFVPVPERIAPSTTMARCGARSRCPCNCFSCSTE